VTEHLPDGTVKSGAEVGVWNLATGAQILKLAGNGAAIRSLAFTADGRGLFTGDSANAVKMWDAATGRFLRDFTGHTGDVSALSRSDDGRFLVSGATDRVVKVWDVGTGGELRALTGHSAPIVLVIFAPMGRQIASVGADGEVRVWEIATGRKISTLKLPRPIEYGLPNLIFSPDGRSLVTADGAAIRQLDVATGREVRMLTGHAKDVSAMTFSPDGKRLASVGEDRALRLWDWATGRELAALRTEINPVAIGFARDGLTLTTLTSRYYVKQWHAASAAEVLAAGK
jgi:WD40 repeat protein